MPSFSRAGSFRKSLSLLSAPSTALSTSLMPSARQILVMRLIRSFTKRNTLTNLVIRWPVMSSKLQALTIVMVCYWISSVRKRCSELSACSWIFPARPSMARLIFKILSVVLSVAFTTMPNLKNALINFATSLVPVPSAVISVLASWIYRAKSEISAFKPCTMHSPLRRCLTSIPG